LFPDVPGWASAVDAKRLDWLIAKGYLKHHQRRDWRAIEKAINNIDYTFLATAFWARYIELGHEIERVHRRINSAEEADRRDYLESWIADYESWRAWLLERIFPLKDGGS
jgi:hypothetical protein